MKIGLFGGTFDPVHRCHVAVATQVRDLLHLDRVLLIPSGDPPHKPLGTLAPAFHRLEMVRLAIAGEPSLEASELEIRRPAKSYSIETVRTLKEQYGPGAELFFLIGLDAFLELHTWKDAPSLLSLCHFVVVSRPLCHFTALRALPMLPPLDPAALAHIDSQGQGRLDIPLPGGTSLILLALPPCEASATDIRRRLRERLPLSNLLPALVESYIMRHRLYQEAPDRTRVEG
ncbi:MAG: nicotinate (nicotinamide) nucleotide adenylyltransferase [Nitrospirae bacterium]|nr:MAG: nicotinate (nicotinamide) nucleotide adenylyltransferase [Nitrospirota bacterium]